VKLKRVAVLPTVSLPHVVAGPLTATLHHPKLGSKRLFVDSVDSLRAAFDLDFKDRVVGLAYRLAANGWVLTGIEPATRRRQSSLDVFETMVARPT
jgi:hypothetical protein